jgi:uncharacterized protein (TIGR03089 family)
VKLPSDVADVLALVTRDPGRPRITWYGVDERIELSGAVLANWVAKVTNLLVEEFDAGPGVRIALDLPAHWRTVVWALATWRCGACAVAGSDGAAQVVVTDRPGSHPAAAQLVAVALPGLARRFDGPLPAGAIDGATAVMTYGDTIGWAPEVSPAAPAVAWDTVAVAHAGLRAWAVAGSGAPHRARVLVAAGGPHAGTVELLRSVLGVLARDGSVVVLGAEMAAELAADPARRSRLMASERVTTPV